jgi:hypothetical protein
MVTEIELFESQYLTQLDFCLWGWMKSEVYKRKVDIRNELLARILVAAAAAARIKKREDQHAIFATQVAKYTEVDGGIFEHLLLT